MTAALTPTPLADLCAPYRTLAIAGTAKNAGKTTALNALLAAYAARGEVLGVSSVGRDGEAIDQLTQRPKPRIHPAVGTLVATAHDSALHSKAVLERVASTPFRTALGPVGIYRVLAPGFVEVAGPVKVKEAARLMGLLREAGAGRVILDGAADRRAFLACGVEAFVLSTGLALEADLDRLAEATRGVLARLSLPPAPAEWEAAFAGAPPGALDAAGAFHPWPGASWLEGPERLGAWLPEGARALWVPGGLTDAVADALSASARRPEAVVLPAGTHLLLSQEAFERLERCGLRFMALRPLHCAAVTCNPMNPHGEPGDPRVLREKLAEALAPLPVVDVEAL